MAFSSGPAALTVQGVGPRRTDTASLPRRVGHALAPHGHEAAHARMGDVMNHPRIDSECTGFVQWFDRRRGYGFVIPLGCDEAFFFSRSDIEGECASLSVDQQVSFVLELGDGRFVARRIRP